MNEIYIWIVRRNCKQLPFFPLPLHYEWSVDASIGRIVVIVSKQNDVVGRKEHLFVPKNVR